MPDDNRKRIVFIEDADRHLQLKLRLKYDCLTQQDFFTNIIEAYLQNDSNMLEVIEKIKDTKKISKANRKKQRKDAMKEKEVKTKFGLDDDEVESIFSIMEKEHPDL